jgi:hypothetical protein
MIETKEVPLSDLGKFLKQLPPLDLELGPVVAGGAARRAWYDQDWRSADVDVFFRDDNQRRRWKREFETAIGLHNNPKEVTFEIQINLSGDSGHSHLSISTDNADTYQVWYQGKSIKVQLIKTRYSENLLNLWNDFDFDASCFATDGQTLAATPSALASVANRKLTVKNSAESRNLTLRVLKYNIYGFEASNELLLQAADSLINGEFNWQTNY